MRLEGGLLGARRWFILMVSRCLNSSLGVGNSPLDLHSADFGIFGDFADFSLVSSPKIPKNHESQTENLPL